MADQAQDMLRELESWHEHLPMTWQDVIVDNAAALIRAQQAEIEALRHDIERHIGIAAKQADVIAALSEMFDLAVAIPTMSDEQLRELVANSRAALRDSEKASQGMTPHQAREGASVTRADDAPAADGTRAAANRER